MIGLILFVVGVAATYFGIKALDNNVVLPEYEDTRLNRLRRLNEQEQPPKEIEY